MIWVKSCFYLFYKTFTLARLKIAIYIRIYSPENSVPEITVFADILTYGVLSQQCDIAIVYFMLAINQLYFKHVSKNSRISILTCRGPAIPEY